MVCSSEHIPKCINGYQNSCPVSRVNIDEYNSAVASIISRGNAGIGGSEVPASRAA